MYQKVNLKEKIKECGASLVDVKDWTKAIIQAAIVAFIFRAFIFDTFKIPSGSMYPNLHEGDILFVSKYKYGYGKHTLWGMPLPLEGRLFFSPPKRGDIIVFRMPKYQKYFIKRLIGLPGDTVKLVHGQLFINDEAVSRVKYTHTAYDDGVSGARIMDVYKETLPTGMSYTVWQENNGGHDKVEDNTITFKVPAGHYFFMGDNRNMSMDSRFSAIGFVPETDLIGRAEVLFWERGMSLDRVLSRERVFKPIPYEDR
jgi:signal peptidase I